MVHADRRRFAGMTDDSTGTKMGTDQGDADVSAFSLGHGQRFLFLQSCRVFSQLGPPGVPTPSLGPVFHPASFLDGPGAQKRPPEAENCQKLPGVPFFRGALLPRGPGLGALPVAARPPPSPPPSEVRDRARGSPGHPEAFSHDDAAVLPHTPDALS